MSEAAERVEAWRRAKRHEGYRQVALWLPAEFKGKLDALAYARHQDIATCVMEAVEYLAHKQGTLKPLRPDAHQQRRLEEKITTTVLQRLATLGVLDAAAVATEAAGALLPEAPLPVSTDDLLPERALSGDGHARRQLVTEIYLPLAEAGSGLLETLTAYLDTSGSIEATSRVLFVHANTVRYRLKRIAEVTGMSPSDARDAYTLRLALTLGRLMSD